MAGLSRMRPKTFGASIFMTDITINSTDRHPRRLHPLALRIMHWINALAMIILIGSGWEIYNDEVIFGWLHFPRWMTIGGGPEGALQWHFAAMWLLMINGLCYLAYGIATGRFRRKLFPIRPRELIATVRDALRFKLPHDDITHYNAVQKLLYVGVIAIIIMQVLSGLAVWKPVQFSELASLFYELPGLAPGAFHRHGADRRVSRRACRAGAAGAENHRRDADRRSRSRDDDDTRDSH